MIEGWKVILKYGYFELVFQFKRDDIDKAVCFVSDALTHYVKDESDGKSLYVSLTPIKKADEEEKGEEK